MQGHEEKQQGLQSGTVMQTYASNMKLVAERGAQRRAMLSVNTPEDVHEKLMTARS